MPQELDYRAIRARADANLIKQRFYARITAFIVSLLSFILLSGIAFSIFKRDSVTAVFLLAFAGLIGVVAQGVHVLIGSPKWEDYMREWLVSKEINRDILRLGLEEPIESEKRKGVMRLTDDGELEEIVEAQADLDDGQPTQRYR